MCEKVGRGRQIAQVKDGGKCEKVAQGDNSIIKRCESMMWWVRRCMRETVLWLEDNRGERKLLRGCCSVYISLFCFTPVEYRVLVSALKRERDSTVHSYLCSLSSNSLIYFIVLSFRRLSGWREGEREDNGILLWALYLLLY